MKLRADWIKEQMKWNPQPRIRFLFYFFFWTCIGFLSLWVVRPISIATFVFVCSLAIAIPHLTLYLRGIRAELRRWNKRNY